MPRSQPEKLRSAEDSQESRIARMRERIEEATRIAERHETLLEEGELTVERRKRLTRYLKNKREQIATLKQTFEETIANRADRADAQGLRVGFINQQLRTPLVQAEFHMAGNKWRPHNCKSRRPKRS